MSSLVSFDQKGAFGPAVTLIYNAKYYNEQALTEITNLLRDNFTKLAHFKPKGRKEFCTFAAKRIQSHKTLTPIDIIQTKFFQNMQKTGNYHKQILQFTVPRMLKSIQDRMVQNSIDGEETKKVQEWLASFLESYMSEDELKQHCEIQTVTTESILEERKKIGMDLYQKALGKEISEKDLNSIISLSEVALDHLKKSDHLNSTLYFTGRYLTLFSMQEDDPEALAKDVLTLLNTKFREKFFSY